jgi:spoIIIJ-associated protein
MDFSEKWGKDVEDAVKLALEDLKLDRNQVEIIVLEEPSKGFFGIGSKLAKVRVEKKQIMPEKAVPNPEVKVTKEKSEINVKNPVVPDESIDADMQNEKSRKQRNRKRESTGEFKDSPIFRERPADLIEVEDAPALEFLKDVTSRMGLDLTIKPFINDSCLYFEISGADTGTIIGKRGQTLDSIQYLTSLVANKEKENEKYLRVIVDAENYRSKRERTLEQLANRLGDKVQKSGKSVKLEPMNPYERKVIHATLQRKSGVTTRSEGEEPYRRVVIEKK